MAACCSVTMAVPTHHNTQSTFIWPFQSQMFRWIWFVQWIHFNVCKKTDTEMVIHYNILLQLLVNYCYCCSSYVSVSCACTVRCRVGQSCSVRFEKQNTQHMPLKLQQQTNSLRTNELSFALSNCADFPQ